MALHGRRISEIAGEIKISLADVELINIKIRLLVASVDKAKEMGIDWWAHDPYLSSRARPEQAITGNTEPEHIQTVKAGDDSSKVMERRDPIDQPIKRPKYRN